MERILFVCHGNICRSPMAEFVMKHLVSQAGLDAHFEIASAATSTEELGNSVYPPARQKLAEHGISCAGKTARQITRADYSHFDHIVAMDRNNLRNIGRMLGDDPQRKVSLLLSHAGRPGCEVADPWYTGDFEATWCDVLDGCQGLLSKLRSRVEK
ncbi:MAG: low molecular weight phosphotyrosine protein phosphatase [Bacteroidales bacterium]|nr:low molecular weight phosphotyrosine protein phosphatase [Bacteroidales bacterium]